MTEERKWHDPVNLSEQGLVISTLAPDQLAEAKEQRVPRHRLRAP